ncbi:mas-related G-protein coupled receptor member H-like [Discoglossus pictus]
MEFNSTDGANFNNSADQERGYDKYAYIHFTIAASFAIALSLIGIVGNIIVFWYLCFKIQRSKYTVYIINLAVADFIFLIFTALIMMIQINTLIGTNRNFPGKKSLYLFTEIFYDFSMYCGMFFLTAISIERCLSVIFPIWYQCKRSPSQSSKVCICLWIFGSAESLIENLVCTPQAFNYQTKECTGVHILTFVIGICICLPLMVTSSLILLVRIRSTLRKQYPPRLYIIIIAAVFIFILSVIPFNFVWFLMFFKLLNLDKDYVTLFYVSVFASVLNSTLNPYIYFIVGRQRKQTSKVSLHQVLQRAFNEDEEEKSETCNESTASSQTNGENVL